MHKVFFVLTFFFSLLNLSFAAQEKLEDRFKTYIIPDTSEIEDFNGGPVAEIINIDKRDIRVYSPELDKKMLDIKPRPKTIEEAIKQPGKFFREDVKEAINNFNNFASTFRSCVSEKKWPQKNECLKTLDICFGIESLSSLCDWEQHDVFSNCAPQYAGRQGLVQCLNTNEKAFNLMSKCFDPRTELSFMFSIHGMNAERRDYYTVDSHFAHLDFGGITHCRFTVLNKKNYQLISIAGGYMGHPGITTIPLDLYARDNYYMLLEYQKSVKEREIMEKRSKKER